jgi:hypothetical protein
MGNSLIEGGSKGRLALLFWFSRDVRKYLLGFCDENYDRRVIAEAHNAKNLVFKYNYIDVLPTLCGWSAKMGKGRSAPSKPLATKNVLR